MQCPSKLRILLVVRVGVSGTTPDPAGPWATPECPLCQVPVPNPPHRAENEDHQNVLLRDHKALAREGGQNEGMVGRKQAAGREGSGRSSFPFYSAPLNSQGPNTPTSVAHIKRGYENPGAGTGPSFLADTFPAEQGLRGGARPLRGVPLNPPLNGHRAPSLLANMC